jgi:hypothetical protein
MHRSLRRTSQAWPLLWAGALWGNGHAQVKKAEVAQWQSGGVLLPAMSSSRLRLCVRHIHPRRRSGVNGRVGGLKQRSARGRHRVPHVNLARLLLRNGVGEAETDRLIELGVDELAAGVPALLCAYPLVETTVMEYVRHSQERLIAPPVLERLKATFGGEKGVERQLVRLLDLRRDRPQAAHGYGPRNVVKLLRHLRGLDLARLHLRQRYLLGVEAQDTSLADASLRDYGATAVFNGVITLAMSADGVYGAVADGRGAVQVWAAGGSYPKAEALQWLIAALARHHALTPARS